MVEITLPAKKIGDQTRVTTQKEFLNGFKRHIAEQARDGDEFVALWRL
jgi:hypothetical protein